MLPASVKPLSMPLYSQGLSYEEELRPTDVHEEEEDFDEAAGEDGLGVIAAGGGWDEEAVEDEEEEGMDEEIEDWD